MQLRSLEKHYKIPTVVTDYMTAGGKSWTGLNTLGAGDLQSWRGPVGRLHAPMPSCSVQCCAVERYEMRRRCGAALRCLTVLHACMCVLNGHAR